MTDATLSTSPHNPNLQHFSVWSVGADSATSPFPGLNRTFVNFFFDVNSTATLQRLHLEGGFGPSLLRVREVLFWPRHAAAHGLRPDFIKRWRRTFAQLRPLLASGAAFGVFLGDELLWDCVPYDDLVTASALVRKDLDAARMDRGDGQRFIIYYNEAFPPLDNITMWRDKCGDQVALRGGFPSVPATIDWTSMDYYPNEGTFDGAQRIYRERLYPKLNEHQRVLFVPPAFGCSSGSDRSFVDRYCCWDGTRDGANPPCQGDCEAAMLRWARASYDWARSDRRFVGLNPWYWVQPGVPDPSTWPPNTSEVPGLYWLPRVRPLWEAIGREIVSGRQGDV